MSVENENQEIDNTEGQEQSQEQQIATWNIVEPTSTPTEGVTRLYEQNTEEQETNSETSTEEQSETQETESEQQETQEEQGNETAQSEIDESKVIDFLKAKGFNAETLEDLKPKEVAELDEEAKKYLDYKKETGRGYKDFLETQKDWQTEDKEVVLLQNLKAENPTLTDSQIERLFKRKYDVSEEYDEDVILDKEIEIEKDYQRGLKLLEDQKEKYMIRKGFDESLPEEVKQKVQAFDSFQKQQEENAIALEKSRADFVAKTESVFSKDFEGFKVKIGDTEFKIKPENVEEAKSTLSDLSNFDKKFFDQTTGELKDPQGYYKAIHFALNPDEVAKHFINVGKALQAEADEREAKNIQTKASQGQSADFSKNVTTWRTVNP
jgi:hypothetical protein